MVYLSGCRKSNSIDCTTDQECEDLLIGTWVQSNLGLQWSRKKKYIFNEDSSFVVYDYDASDRDSTTDWILKVNTTTARDDALSYILSNMQIRTYDNFGVEFHTTSIHDSHG